MITEEINGNTIEFIEEDHTYIVNGLITKSVTQLLQEKFPKKYEGVPRQTLNNAAEKGTMIHKAIENYITKCEKPHIEELYDFIYLKDLYNFEVLESEKMIVYILEGIPLYVGRLDLILQEDGKTVLADIKTTSTLDLEYLSYQLSLYATAYEQCYGKKIDGLRAIHLKNGKRKYREIKRLDTLELIKEVLTF